MSELGRVIKRLEGFFTHEDAWTWVERCNDLLNGERAIDLIAEGRVDEVDTVIGQLSDGAYI